MSDRRGSNEPTATLTQAAVDRLQAELDELTTAGRANMSVRLQHARELGDIRENAEYDAAKNEQGLMEARIRQLQQLLKDVQLVEAPEHGDKVMAGMLVTLRPEGEDDEDEEETYLLAESKEERAPGARTVTTESPLGSVIVGRAAGDTVTYAAPGGEFSYRIVSFRPA